MKHSHDNPRRSRHLALSLLVWASCSFLHAEPLKPSPHPDVVRFWHRNHRFGLNLPARWEIQENSHGLAVSATRPSTGPTDPFLESVSVIVDRLSSPQNTLSYLKRSVSELKKNLKRFELHEQGLLKLGRGEGCWLVYSYEANRRHAKAYQSLILVGKTAYTITGAARPAMFPQYRPIFQQIAESFTSAASH